MRTKGKHTRNKAFLEYKDEGGVLKKELFYFDYASAREKTFTQPFGQPIASSNDLIISDTQLPFKVNRHVEINNRTSMIVNVKATPLNEKVNKRIAEPRYVYLLEIT